MMQLNSQVQSCAHSQAIGHMVCWRVNGTSPAQRSQQCLAIVNLFEALRGTVVGLQYMHVGCNTVEHADAWDVLLYMVFDSGQALQAYMDSGTHQRIKAEVGPMRASRNQADILLSSDMLYEISKASNVATTHE